jgi:hypothetical protein
VIQDEIGRADVRFDYQTRGWVVVKDWHVASPFGGTDYMPWCLIVRHDDSPIRDVDELVVTSFAGRISGQLPRETTKL